MYQTSFDVSRPHEVVLSTYLRTSSVKRSDETGHRRTESQIAADVFLAATTVLPTFDPRRMSDGWYKATHGHGEFRIQLGFKPAKFGEPLTIADFELLKVIGKGSFGKVSLLSPLDERRPQADPLAGSGTGHASAQEGHW